MKSLNSRKFLICNLLFAAVSVSSTQAKSEIFGGVNFPQGAASFADAVLSYSPAGPPGLPYQGSFNALGVPNYTGANTCANQASCTFVSLGQGGGIVLSFVDNKLTGSGSNALDLWIFEVGPDVEDTFVDISKDGVNWWNLGKVFGSTAGIDIDAFGFGTSDEFEFIRLTDDPNEGGGGVGGTPGADIDAVGAISTVLSPPGSTTVPGPLPVFGAATAFIYSRKLRNRIRDFNK